METEKLGPYSKLVNVVFFKIPWYIYLGILIGLPVVIALLGLIVPDIVHSLIFVIAAFALTYVILSLLLQIAMKVSRSKNYVDLAYAIFYSRSYVFFIVVFFVFGLIFGYTGEYVERAIPQDFLGTAYYLLLLGGWLTVLAISAYGFFGALIRFTLRRFAWCPACGRFFALQTTSRGVIDTQEINVKKTVDTRNSRGQVIGQQDQYVSGTREIIQKVKTCKYCGSTLTSTKARDYANV